MAHSPRLDNSTPDAGVHLWIPEPEARDSASEAGPSSSRAPQLLKERLYVGNLGPAADEYALLQVFTKFGKIAKLDFLFHKSGIHKGKPRGYAFVEYMDEADATKALQAANGKLLRGRKLVVTFAQQAPNHDFGSTSYTGRSKRADTTPTALSLAKSSGIARPEAKTSSKIAMMEAKLRQMANSSSFADKPALPTKPAGSQRSSRDIGARSQRLSLRGGSRLVSARPERTKHDEQTSYERTILPSMRESESSDVSRIPHSNKQRSIPGVKIVKGGTNNGNSGITPSTRGV